MASNYVPVKAIQVGIMSYHGCPKDVSINCEASSIRGTVWFVPNIKNGVFTGYNRVRSSTKPTTDSVKTVEVKDNNTGLVTWVLINDNQTETELTERCAACCGDVTATDAVTIPAVIIEEAACCEVPEQACEYNFLSPVAALPVGKAYSASGSKEGVAFTPAVPAAGFASLALLVAWANTNWVAYGTFSVSGQTVKLVTNYSVGSLNVTIITPP